jgi:Sulfotransferase family
MTASKSAAAFLVDLQDPRGIIPRLQTRRVAFHGVNKSGSLALANVLKEAYRVAGRSDQFISHYHRVIPSLDALIAAIMAQDGKPAFFVSHALYKAFDADTADVSHVSLIRHPIPRIVSCYQWMKNKYIQREKTDKGYPTLEKFIQKKSTRGHFQNVQFAIGFCPRRSDLLKELTERQIFDRAQKALLQDFAWFGIAEYFEETIFSFALMLGLGQVPVWKRDNRNANRSLVTDLDPNILGLIEEKLMWEIDFYNFARDVFLERIQALKFGGSFDSYRKACVGEYKDRLLAPDGRK